MLGYLYAKREFNEALRSYQHKTNTKIKALTVRLAAAEKRVEIVATTAGTKQTDGQPANFNPFLKMEDRLERELGKKVTVNGESVPFIKA